MAVRGVPRSLVISTLLVLCVMGSAAALAGQAPVAPPPSFEEVTAKAARARDAGASDEAIRWYRRGVRMRAGWDEGWWYLATLLYERDRYAEAAAAFGRFLALKPEPGPALALRGLCEFQVKDYAASLRHLGEWMTAGSAGNAETQQVAWYHLSILRIRGGQFELALEPMTQLCRSGPESPRAVRAAGLMLLRLATFPAEVPREKEGMVDVAGRAAYSWLALKVDDAQARFKELITAFSRSAERALLLRPFPSRTGLRRGPRAVPRGDEGPAAERLPPPRDGLRAAEARRLRGSPTLRGGRGPAGSRSFRRAQRARARPRRARRDPTRRQRSWKKPPGSLPRAPRCSSPWRRRTAGPGGRRTRRRPRPRSRGWRRPAGRRGHRAAATTSPRASIPK